MPAPKHKNTPKKAQMLKALEESLGVVTVACKKVGLERCTHYNWMNADPEYKRNVEAIGEVVLDFAESHLHKRIKDGSDSALIFLLKCKGKQRGYIEKQEIDMNANIEAKVSILDFSNAR